MYESHQELLSELEVWLEPVVRKKQHGCRVKQELSSGHPVSLGCWSSWQENQKLSDGLDLTGGLLIGQDSGISSSTDEQKWWSAWLYFEEEEFLGFGIYWILLVGC